MPLTRPGRIVKLRTQFFTECPTLYNNKYNYSKVNYINSNIKVCIVCPIHGDFNITPSRHLRGKECQKCSAIVAKKKLTRTLEDFITISSNVHNNKYGYARSVYINERTKIIITCPIHGDFRQRPHSHVRGQGCPACNSNREMSLETFVDRSNKVHNNKYLYDNVIYINSIVKVEIVCPEHGSFWQRPESHYGGRGCPRCAGFSKTTQDFIKEANHTHDNKYSYVKTVYAGSLKPIVVTCPQHGDFNLTAHQHLRGVGCKRCNANYSKPHQKVVNYLEILQFRSPEDFLINDQKTIINPHTKKSLELDIWFPGRKLAIEVDGVYIHSSDYSKVRDQLKDKLCLEKGIKLLRVTDEEVYKNWETVIQKLRSELLC